MTLVFPLVERLLAGSNCAPRRGAGPARSIAILVPVHDEAGALAETLRSITSAIRLAAQSWNGKAQIYVGADGCSDESAEVARSFGAEVIEFPRRQGKWRTLRSLAKHCCAYEWLVFADAGATWPETLLAKMIAHSECDDLMGIAPTYRNPSGGMIERCLWAFERSMKRLESTRGRVVSVHGATVCYRTLEYLAATEQLGAGEWLNDDVVIPLAMRGLFPTKRIVYLAETAVSEAPRVTVRREYNRRRRMALGNIQWIRELWIPLWMHNRNAAMVASRRVFRLLWAYWLLMIGSGAALLAAQLLNPALRGPVLVGLLSIAGLAVLTHRGVRALCESAAASLLVPYYILTANFTYLATPEATDWR